MLWTTFCAKHNHRPTGCRGCKKDNKTPLDVHLMIERPDDLIPEFIKAGSNYITVHVESAPPPPHNSVYKGKGCKGRCIFESCNAFVSD